MTKKLNTKDMAMISIFVVIIAICSWISIPSLVPFTLQTFAIFLSVAILGGKRGCLAVFIYLLMGAIGLPVFSNFSSGVSTLLGSTGGYIIGFIFSALVMWAMEIIFGRNQKVLLVSMFIGLFVLYVFGTVWFMLIYARDTGNIGLLMALSYCVFPYIIPDILKIMLVLIIYKRVKI